MLSGAGAAAGGAGGCDWRHKAALSRAWSWLVLVGPATLVQQRQMRRGGESLDSTCLGAVGSSGTTEFIALFGQAGCPRPSTPHRLFVEGAAPFGNASPVR